MAQTLKINGAALKALREAHGWRGSKFAIAVGISHGYLVNIEKGARQPNVETIRKMADTLGVELAALTGVCSESDAA